MAYYVCPSKSNERGVILVIVLWILVILTVFVAGMSKRGQVDMALAQYAVGETRAKYIAWSAVHYAASRIAEDTNDEIASKFDTMGQCGYHLGKQSTVEQLFKHVPVKDGYFDIVGSWQRAGDKARYGFTDEDGRINLNAMAPEYYQVLKYLIKDAGFSDDAAATVTASVIDWIDSNNEVFDTPRGNETLNPSAGQAPVKNLPFQNIGELLLVKGMTPDIYKAIKDYVTVVPRGGKLGINLDTAPQAVLRALALNFAGDRQFADLSSAEALVDKIVRYRRGPDGIDGTADDRTVDRREMPLNSREDTIMARMENIRAVTSNFFRFGVFAKDEQSGMGYKVEVIMQRRTGDVLYWHRV